MALSDAHCEANMDTLLESILIKWRHVTSETNANSNLQIVTLASFTPRVGGI